MTVTVKGGTMCEQYYEDKANGKIEVAEEVKDAADAIMSILDSVYDERSYRPEDARSKNVELKVNQDKLAMPERN